MKWPEFTQASLFFLLFLLAIIIFQILGLDVNFVTTFIMAIFTLTISIFFFIESNKLMSNIKDKVVEMQGDLKSIASPDFTEDLNILGDYNNRRLISSHAAVRHGGKKSGK